MNSFFSPISLTRDGVYVEWVKSRNATLRPQKCYKPQIWANHLHRGGQICANDVFTMLGNNRKSCTAYLSLLDTCSWLADNVPQYVIPSFFPLLMWWSWFSVAFTKRQPWKCPRKVNVKCFQWEAGKDVAFFVFKQEAWGERSILITSWHDSRFCVI